MCNCTDMLNDSRQDVGASRNNCDVDSSLSIQLRSQQIRRKPRVLFTQSQVNLIIYYFITFLKVRPYTANTPVLFTVFILWHKKIQL